MSDWNNEIISEFREHEGKVGGMFEGAPLLLLHHNGAAHNSTFGRLFRLISTAHNESLMSKCRRFVDRTGMGHTVWWTSSY